MSDINTTFYIDDKHRIMITWAGPVEADLPEGVETQEEFEEFVESFGLRSQHLYVRFFNHDINKYVIDVFYFTKTGTIYWAGEYEETV